MKKVLIIVIGSLLFVAGYNYTRRQSVYKATQPLVAKPAKAPVAFPLKTLPTFVFRSDKSFLSSN